MAGGDEAKPVAKAVGRPRTKSGALAVLLASYGHVGATQVDLVEQVCQVSRWSASQIVAGAVLLRPQDLASLAILFDAAELHELAQAQGAPGLADCLAAIVARAPESAFHADDGSEVILDD